MTKEDGTVPRAKPHRFIATESAGEVSALMLRPDDAHSLLVFAHGAGAGMTHAFMSGMANDLARVGVATFRYQFPYTEQGRRSPDRRPVLFATVRSAIAAARSIEPELPLYAGGKSMGGRMTSLAASETPLDGVRGIVFFGFPLHAAGRPSSERGEHLAAVDVPLLFLQGTRDSLADLTLLEPIVKALGSEGATMHIVEGGDHSFRVPRSSGRRDDDVREELARVVSAWMKAHSS